MRSLCTFSIDVCMQSKSSKCIYQDKKKRTGDANAQQRICMEYAHLSRQLQKVYSLDNTLNENEIILNIHRPLLWMKKKIKNTLTHAHTSSQKRHPNAQKRTQHTHWYTHNLIMRHSKINKYCLSFGWMEQLLQLCARALLLAGWLRFCFDTIITNYKTRGRATTNLLKLKYTAEKIEAYKWI